MGAVVERHEGVVGSVALRCTELTVIGRVYSAWCASEGSLILRAVT